MTGQSRRGGAWQGLAGGAGHGRRGLARLGKARQLVTRDP